MGVIYEVSDTETSHDHPLGKVSNKNSHELLREAFVLQQMDGLDSRLWKVSLRIGLPACLSLFRL